jgi:hypothetical protein
VACPGDGAGTLAIGLHSKEHVQDH